MTVHGWPKMIPWKHLETTSFNMSRFVYIEEMGIEFQYTFNEGQFQELQMVSFH
jgi:hypothetical protein